jgi:predicted amidohydrolase
MKAIVLAVAQSIAVPGDVIRSVQEHARLARSAAERGARLVLFPELSLTGYDRRLSPADAIPADDPRLKPLQALADAHAILIIAGAPIELAGRLHIGALCFRPQYPTSVYTKRFLHEGEEVAFAPGTGGEIQRIDNLRVGLAICAEIAHPQHAKQAAEQGVDIYAASCFITPTGYAYDTGLLQEYSREHRMVTLMANYGAPSGDWKSAGGSAIWSSTGTRVALAPEEGEAVIVAELTF